MAKFKVGDRARVVRSETHPDSVGAEVEIFAVGEFEGFYTSKIYKYTVLVITGKYAGREAQTDDDYLEPIIELGSWDEIEKATGWKRGTDLFV